MIFENGELIYQLMDYPFMEEIHEETKINMRVYLKCGGKMEDFI